MKKIILLLVLTTSIVFAQETPELTRAGVTELIQPAEGLTAADMYAKTKEWLQTAYKNPSEVLKADIENQMIRINGFSPNFFLIKSLTTQNYDVQYGMTFSFKDGKYKVDFEVLDITYNGQRPLIGVHSFFKKKDGSVRKVYKTAYDSFLVSLTALYKQHYDYITGVTTAKNDDW